MAMKLLAKLLLGCGLLSQFSVAVNPVGKVVQLLSELEAKITKDGEAEDQAYAEYAEFCKTSSTDKGYEIKTAKGEIEDLKATIGKADADISAASSKVEELAGTISGNDADLKAATGIREKEKAEFQAAESELVETVGTLDRAINILQKKLKGSALMQAKVNTQDLNKLVKVLSAVVDAASLSLHDKKKLMALAQSSSGSDDDDDEGSAGAPAPEAYKGHSESIVDVLEDLREKAETQLSEARKEETNARHNYEMLKQSLVDQIAADNKELAEAKATKYNSAEVKATAQGDLTVTKKDLADAEDALAELNGGCRTAAADHEASVASRAEELKALSEAKKAIVESSKGAEGQVYGAASFLQSDSNGQGQITTHADLANFEVVNMIKQLAKQYRSSTLLQLAGRIQAVMKYGDSAGEDPFAKVKALITDMIAKLEQEATSEASHKAYCDKEMGDTKTRLEDLTGSIDSLTSKIDKKAALSAKLKGEVQELQAELAELQKMQVEMDKVRKAEQTAFLQKKTDLEQGLDGVRMALKVLREYYANADGAAALLQQPAAPEYHKKASGSGGGIIGMLEVIESDFGKSLAQATTDEDSAEMEYDKTTQINKVTKATKESDVKYKSKEAIALDKSVTELSSDRTSAQSTLDAEMEFKKSIINSCVAKPDTYEERKSRREAEVAGLKEALQILSGETVFMQKKQGGLRGAAIHHH